MEDVPEYLAITILLIKSYLFASTSMSKTMLISIV
ncbi:hypothetical protein ALC56_13536 [Trachymyrmex septentrionalis]|uniref:Uncharacterized protein n=1 Tax=Trachymyrmex septentrionalis TaxID=34720 RepID=A0A195EV89_9HYME|nr:hypothetical protein ALC56_13536 [Trachymyrmex septentrionalis]